jgi:5-methylcytosine-specific restriction endonuclease McrA
MLSNLLRLTLVLNKSYIAINVVSARRAITMVMKGAAHVVEPSTHVIRAGRMMLPVPLIIRCEEYNKIPSQSRSVSRKSILMRDRFTCQYCRHPFPAAALTMDHVIPRSRGGQNTWENLVTCCFPCNNRKGNMTLAEAGMVLMKKPARVGIHAKHRLLIEPGQYKEWDQYLLC